MGQIFSNTAQDSTVERTESKPVLYHALAQALLDGRNTRPGLPVELVAYILRLADCTVISRRLSKSVNRRIKVKASDSQLHDSVWFRTPPFEGADSAKLARLQLCTVSRDQGWCSNFNQGSWSWFYIALIVPVANVEAGMLGQQYKVKQGPDGANLIWKSHNNPIASSDFTSINGQVFEPHHNIWKHINEGDRLEIRACARFPGWTNEATHGTLQIEEWFDPTSPFPNPDYL